MSNAKFKQNIAKFVERAGARADEVVAKFIISMTASLISKSPVDTGRFRANWQFGVGKVNTSIGSGTANSALNRVMGGLSNGTKGQTLYITNSMPYARRLEYGWSKQAPGGMVRLTVNDANIVLRKAVKEGKK